MTFIPPIACCPTAGPFNSGPTGLIHRDSHLILGELVPKGEREFGKSHPSESHMGWSLLNSELQRWSNVTSRQARTKHKCRGTDQAPTMVYKKWLLLPFHLPPKWRTHQGQAPGSEVLAVLFEEGTSHYEWKKKNIQVWDKAFLVGRFALVSMCWTLRQSRCVSGTGHRIQSASFSVPLASSLNNRLNGSHLSMALGSG